MAVDSIYLRRCFWFSLVICGTGALVMLSEAIEGWQIISANRFKWIDLEQFSFGKSSVAVGVLPAVGA